MQPRDYHRMSLLQGDRNKLPEVREFRKIDKLNPSMFMTSQVPVLKDALVRSPYGKQQKYELKHEWRGKKS